MPGLKVQLKYFNLDNPDLIPYLHGPVAADLGWKPADIASEDADLLFTSPLPAYPHDRYFGQFPTKVPPPLVLQGTLDPKTPYAGA
jgi:hypothetical protein